MREGLVFRAFGQLRAWQDGLELNLGSRQQRLTLAVLLAESGRTVSMTTMASAVWDDAVPIGAPSTLRTYVLRLRRVLSAPDHPVIVSAAGGYQLALGEGQLDLAEFHGLLGAAEATRARQDLVATAAHLTKAVDIGRNTPFADLGGLFIDMERMRLRRVWIGAVEDLAEIQLGLGRHAAIIDDLATAVEDDPMRERLRELLMLALYRSGRQAEALAQYDEVRARLREELGVDPWPALRDLHLRILNADPVLSASIEPVQTQPGRGDLLRRPAQLPSDLPAFVGRSSELDLITPRSAVWVISGMAGAGKTALAVHVGHQLAQRYPDGQIFVNLRGLDQPAAMRNPVDALREILEALGVPPQSLPTTESALAGLYRTVLADRQLLIVLDNARDTEQVRPLLPGRSSSLVLITSRNRMTGLITATSAATVLLDTFSACEAAELLVLRLGKRRTGAEPEAVREIVALCGGLPLALAIVAARAAEKPDFPLAAIVAELAVDRAERRLDAFSLLDTPDDLVGLFSWSYRALSPEAARLFRLLALHPGASVTVNAAASLLGECVHGTRRSLAELDRANLWTEASPGRYVCHDLLRTYGMDRLSLEEPTEQRCAAERRLFDHYVHSADRSDRFLSGHHAEAAPVGDVPAGVFTEKPATEAEAVDWFGIEYPAMVAVIGRMHALAPRRLWQLTWTMRHFQVRHLRRQDVQEGHELALVAAQSAGDRLGVAFAHRGIAVGISVSRPDSAAEHLTKALKIFEDLGEETYLAYTHRHLAAMLQLCHDHEGSVTHAKGALSLFREAGQQLGEALALNALGEIAIGAEDYDEAQVHLREALAVLEHTEGDFALAAGTLDDLGYIYELERNYDLAADCYEKCLEIYRRIGTSSLVDTLESLARVYAARGSADRARCAAEEARKLKNAYGDSYETGASWFELAADADQRDS